LKNDVLSNAGVAGFSKQISLLIGQGHVFKDKEYFTLKIYNLPNTKIEPVL